jgi:hypothetical protein
MSRMSRRLAIALSVAAIALATVPASAYPEPVRGPITFNRQDAGPFGPRVAGRDKLPESRTTVGLSRYRFPGKSKR